MRRRLLRPDLLDRSTARAFVPSSNAKAVGSAAYIVTLVSIIAGFLWSRRRGIARSFTVLNHVPVYVPRTNLPDPGYFFAIVLHIFASFHKEPLDEAFQNFSPDIPSQYLPDGN